MRKVLYIFGVLTDADVDWIARTGARRRMRGGETVIREGERIESLVILLQGEFLISTQAVGEIARRGVGEIVGEMSFVDSAPPFATVTAVDDCLALFLDRQAVLQKLKADPAFGCRFYRALAIFLADRLRGTSRHAASDSLQNLATQTIAADELDMDILDTVSLAGERFDRMLKVLIGER